MTTGKIIFCDFESLGLNDQEKTFSDLSLKIKNSDEKKDLLLNLEDVFLSNRFKNELKHFLTENNEHIRAAAAYGVGKGLRRLILNVLHMNLHIADDREEAEDWLSMNAEEIL